MMVGFLKRIYYIIQSLFFTRCSRCGGKNISFSGLQRDRMMGMCFHGRQCIDCKHSWIVYHR